MSKKKEITPEMVAEITNKMLLKEADKGGEFVIYTADPKFIEDFDKAMREALINEAKHEKNK
jgi:DNA polymerase III alpha subunit (gram-positive type)